MQKIMDRGTANKYASSKKDLNLNMSLIVLNVNGLNTPVKR